MERLWKMWQHLYHSLSLIGKLNTVPSNWNHNNTCASQKIQNQKATLPVLMHHFMSVVSSWANCKILVAHLCVMWQTIEHDRRLEWPSVSRTPWPLVRETFAFGINLRFHHFTLSTGTLPDSLSYWKQLPLPLTPLSYLRGLKMYQEF